VPANSADSFPSTSEAARTPVDVRRFPWVRRLAADYAFDFPSVASFFAGDPSDRAAWSRAVQRAQAHPRRRAEIARVVADQQRRRGAPAGAVEAGRLLADPRSVGIVTGQQAGLFGGPVFTLLKAITALKLAEQVSREHQVPAVAVFWIDAEDHDWDEVRSCTVFDESLTPRTVSLPPTLMPEPAPVATVHLDESAAAAIDELERALPATEFRASLLADLRRCYVPGATMVEAFGRWLETVLGERGLVVFDASDPAAKPLAGQVFARELAAAGRTSRLAADAGAALEARGYHAQVQPNDDNLALFHLDRGRRAVRQQNGRFIVGDQQFAPEAMLRRAEEAPGSFSPNVLLRPIVQDTLFPTAAYVAGPNELAYLGQLKEVYDHFGVPMPLMFPRASMTLVDSAALRFLTKHDVPLEALQPQDESALNALLASLMPPAVEQAFAAAAEAVEREMAGLIAAIPAIDPTLEGAANSTLGRMRHDLETLRGKMIQAAKRRDETLRRQYMRTRALTFPQGHAQERTIGFVSFVNQYGPALVERLAETLPLDMGCHWIVAI
jgi:bacillithiol biosynthesis cysteine-adding enzyme BshC